MDICFNNTLEYVTIKQDSDRIGWVMVSVLAPSVANRGLEPRSCQPKDFKIGICFFSAMPSELRSTKAKIGWFRYGIISQIRAVCLPAEF